MHAEAEFYQLHPESASKQTTTMMNQNMRLIHSQPDILHMIIINGLPIRFGIKLSAFSFKLWIGKDRNHELQCNQMHVWQHERNIIVDANVINW